LPPGRGGHGGEYQQFHVHAKGADRKAETVIVFRDRAGRSIQTTAFLPSQGLETTGIFAACIRK
jgi:hypothetical protein